MSGAVGPAPVPLAAERPPPVSGPSGFQGAGRALSRLRLVQRPGRWRRAVVRGSLGRAGQVGAELEAQAGPGERRGVTR